MDKVLLSRRQRKIKRIKDRLETQRGLLSFGIDARYKINTFGEDLSHHECASIMKSWSEQDKEITSSNSTIINAFCSKLYVNNSELCGEAWQNLEQILSANVRILTKGNKLVVKKLNRYRVTQMGYFKLPFLPNLDNINLDMWVRRYKGYVIWDILYCRETKGFNGKRFVFKEDELEDVSNKIDNFYMGVLTHFKNLTKKSVISIVDDGGKIEDEKGELIEKEVKVIIKNPQSSELKIKGFRRTVITLKDYHKKKKIRIKLIKKLKVKLKANKDEKEIIEEKISYIKNRDLSIRESFRRITGEYYAHNVWQDSIRDVCIKKNGCVEFKRIVDAITKSPTYIKKYFYEEY